MADMLLDEFDKIMLAEVEKERREVCKQRNNDCYGCPFEDDCAAEDVEDDDYWG